MRTRLTVAVLIAMFAVSLASAQGRNVYDSPHKWAEAGCQSAIEMGTVKGYPDGTFRWRNPASREEALHIAREEARRAAASAKQYADENMSELARQNGLVDPNAAQPAPSTPPAQPPAQPQPAPDTPTPPAAEIPGTATPAGEPTTPPEPTKAGTGMGTLGLGVPPTWSPLATCGVAVAIAGLALLVLWYQRRPRIPRPV